jgi:cell wall-associated NlpC family hydrolase
MRAVRSSLWSLAVVLGMFCAAGCQTSRPGAGRPPRTPALPPSGGLKAPVPAPEPSATRPGSPVGRPAAAAWREAATRWLGTPYRWGGNDRRGIDCSGFTVRMHEAVARRTIPRTTIEQYLAGRPVSEGQLRAGDLLFFRTTGPGVSHVGVWLGDGQFAHATRSRGVIISSLREPYWASRYLGARRLPE